MSKYVRRFDKKNFSQTIGLMLSVLAVSHISRHNFNMWFSFFLYSVIPLVVYVLSYFILSKIINFQFKIDDLMIVLPWEKRTSINSLALTFSLWAIVSFICIYEWGIAIPHHYGILLSIGLLILLIPSIALFSFLFFVIIAKFFIKLRNKFK
jgi:hypothetical protein